ncbi:hypothetical protein [Sphingomonas morindae]|uniref:Uncharacterized protein n=1 Tax=Sphingomonas morindae TaxID=1541170 RepID=A0ABY4XBB6_9SPHN|nr:hypothetical protein [Sphingomonas morindae]USI74046.1 hypothetical protein LHA26_06175 [Sphingomonas morindae]
MIETDPGRRLVADVRETARRHRLAWGELVPDATTINAAAEGREEEAYQEMAAAKRRLRDHICDTYGISAAELCALASL